jgi:hypothetical protein
MKEPPVHREYANWKTRLETRFRDAGSWACSRHGRGALYGKDSHRSVGSGFQPHADRSVSAGRTRDLVRCVEADLAGESDVHIWWAFSFPWELCSRFWDSRTFSLSIFLRCGSFSMSGLFGDYCPSLLRLGHGSPAPASGRRVPALAVLILGGLTWKQSETYLDAETLYGDTLQKNPDSWMAHNQRGTSWSGAGVGMRRSRNMKPR